MKKLLFALLFPIALFSQVGINTVTPDASSVLDVTATDRGILIPRISIPDLNLAAPVTSPTTSLLVYNTDTTTGVGFYYWNGTMWTGIGNNNIYTANGTIGADRTVTMNTKTLTFNSTATTQSPFSINSNSLTTGSAFSVSTSNNSVNSTNGIFRVVNSGTSVNGITARIQSNSTANSGLTVLNNGNVGIGNAAPARVLDANAGSNPIRITNLPSLPSTTASNSLVIDPLTGDVYTNNVSSVVGQIIRIGINSQNITTTESAVRFNNNCTSALMGNAPNAAPNFINTIVGSSIATGVVLAAGQGTIARTSDQITLPVGIYKVTARIGGNFSSALSSRYSYVKCIVNNNEYSLINYSNYSTVASNLNFEDYINITGSAQTLDFSAQIVTAGGGTFTINDHVSPGTGESYRSLILIERLR